MTALAITPNFDKKTAKFKGAIAAGEHVAVTIQNDGEYVASTTNLRLRVVDPVCGKTLAIFPQPVEEGETPETWDSDLTPLSCELNLNTDRMLKAVPPAATVPLLFVLDDKEADTLYFKDMCEVTHWPQVRGEDEPYNLDDYPDIIEDFKDRLADAESDIADAVSDVAQAVESVNTAISGIDGKVSAAVSSAVPAAVADKADKVEDAVAGNFAGLNSSGNPTDSGKKPADFAPASHASNGDIHVTAAQKTAWSAKQDAISDLSDIRSKANSAYQVPDGGIPKSALHAEVQESLGKADSTASAIEGCVNAAEYDSASKKILLQHGTTTVAEIDATGFIKDGMVSSVEISNGYLVITFNTDAGIDPISIPLTDIFDPDNYYDKTAADALLAGKVSTSRTVNGKALTNDVTLTGADIAVSGTDATKINAALAGKVSKSGGTMTGGLTVTDLTVGLRASGSTVGLNSVAEGLDITASGDNSHAEGFSTTASGDYSHAEGENTTASGDNSHAEGENTTASGDNSHAEGRATTAQNAVEHAQGRFNVSNKTSTTFGDAGNTLSSIGFGTNTARKNAVETMQDGKTFIYGLGGYDGTNPTNATDLAAVINGKQSKITASGVLKGDGAGGVSAATAGTDYQAPLSAQQLANIEAVTNKANDNAVVHRTGNETVGGVKTFNSEGVVVYDSQTELSMKILGSGITVTDGYYTANFYVPNITGGGGTFALLSDVTGKADKDESATSGNLAKFDSQGNPIDSQIPAANVAVKADLRYSLVTKTISNGAVSLDDRASNAVTISTTLSPNTLTINFPTAPTGKVRDFAMRLNIAAGVTAPEIAWPQGVTLENDGGEVPEIADGGTGGSSTILYFSETENDGTTAKFLVKGETLTAITQA